MSNIEFEKIVNKKARNKLERIIEREGTLGGLRLTEKYFNQLLSEARRELGCEAISLSGGLR